jgi:hypothetical protein
MTTKIVWAYPSPIIRLECSNENNPVINPIINVATVKKILCIIWNSKVHHRLHNSLPQVPTMIQKHPVHINPSRFFKVILILSSHLRLRLQGSFRFYNQILVCIFILLESSVVQRKACVQLVFGIVLSATAGLQARADIQHVCMPL